MVPLSNIRSRTCLLMLFLVLMPALRLSHSGTVFTLGTAGSPWLWFWGGTGPAATQGAAEEAMELLSEEECLKKKQDEL